MRTGSRDEAVDSSVEYYSAVYRVDCWHLLVGLEARVLLLWKGCYVKHVNYLALNIQVKKPCGREWQVSEKVSKHEISAFVEPSGIRGADGRRQSSTRVARWEDLGKLCQAALETNRSWRRVQDFYISHLSVLALLNLKAELLSLAIISQRVLGFQNFRECTL